MVDVAIVLSNTVELLIIDEVMVDVATYEVFMI